MDLVEVSKRQEIPVNRHPWELARLEVVNSLLKEEIKNEPSYTVLDIGCGDIYFISSLSDRYPNVSFYAIDIAFTDEMLEVLKKQAQGKKIHLFKTLEEASAHLSKPANLVLLLDVIEHIEDDNGFLKHLHSSKAIDQDTKIMITVPAYQKLFCSHDHFLGHYRRYTNASLLSTIQSCGFEKLKLGYFFTSLIPPRMLQVFKEKLSPPSKDNSTTGLVEWNKSEGVTRFVTNVLLFDFKVYRFIRSLTGLNIPGLSNFILCKKRA